MPRPGWLKLWRNIEEHRLYKEKPFSKFQAWIDLLIRANYRESKLIHPRGASLITLNPGELVISSRGLSSAWGWSRDRTTRFLILLENDAMIQATSKASYTHIKILNWNKFQMDGVENESTDESIDKAGGKSTGKSTRKSYHKKRRREEGGEGAPAPRPAPVAPPATDGSNGTNGNGFHLPEGLEDQDYATRMAFWSSQEGWKASGGFRCRLDCPECNGKVVHVGAGFGMKECSKAEKV